MNDVEKRAREVLSALASRGNHLILQYLLGSVDEAVSALSAAGLLADPLAQRALEACKVHDTRYASMYTDEALRKRASVSGDACGLVSLVGREALAREKAQRAREAAQQEGPYVPGLLGAEVWGVFQHGLPLPTLVLNQPQARAVAAALNRVHREGK